MSILVVNSLKNSAGSAPTLTIPTSDGTDGQVLQSSNNAGNLIFAGAQLEAGNGTNITFPASAADNQTFVTDANGNLTATTASPNPMNNEDNQQGARLLDKYVFSGGTAASSVSLTVPTGYTNTDLNTIRTMKLVIRGLGVSTGSSWRAILQLIEQDGTDFFGSGGSNTNATYSKMGVQGKSNQTGSINYNNNGQQQYFSRYTNYRTTGGATNEDYFSGTTISADQANNAAGMLNAVFYINPASSPSIIAKSDYTTNSDQAAYANEQVYLGNLNGGLASGDNTGRHPMGIKISNPTGNNFISGFMELYGVFKDGVVS